MKKLVFFFIFISILFHLMAETKHALFIGNSITYMGDIPQKFETIADAFGDSVDVRLHTPGGTGICDHVVSEALYETIREGIWDYFIIQPGSGESPGTSTPPEITLERIETILDSVYYYNPYVQPLFYEISCRTWGNSQEDLLTYNETMDAILSNVQYWADNTETFLAPIGETLRNAWNANQDTLFWNDYDDIHLNEYGSYIAACVFYASIFQKPSFGSEFCGDLNHVVAEEYQQMADDMTLNNFPDWRINTYNFWIDFDIEQNLNEISIINNSSNLENVSWDFGDGTISEEFAPEHVYQEIGSYNLTLNAGVIYNSGAEAVISETLEVNVTELNVSAEQDITANNKISIYPNPFRLSKNNILKISFDLPQNNLINLGIYNAKGQIVRSLISSEQENLFWDGKDLNGKNVSSGLYLIKASVGKDNYNEKILILK